MTYKEIASKLNISASSLSIVINHKPGVSQATRERVIAQLKEMNLGHLLKDKSTPASQSLCFIIYKRDGKILDLHPFFLLLMENIENRARTFGYSVLLCTVDKRRPIEPQIAYINELQAQGAILFGTEMDNDDILYFKELDLPFVILDNDFTRLDLDTVSINNQMGTYQAVEYLAEKGHKRIGYLKSKIRISSFKERHQGYEQALAHFHLGFLPEDIWTVGYTEEESYRDISRLLNASALSLPSAFVCDDDTIALGAMRAFKEQGYQIPGQLSVIGFNDRPACELADPSLTSVSVSKLTWATETVDALIRLMESKKNPPAEIRSKKIRIGTKLIIRSSVWDLPETDA